MAMQANIVFSALAVATAASGSNAGLIRLRGLMQADKTDQTPTDAYNAAAAGFLDMGVGTCVMHDGSDPAVQAVSGLTCAPFCAISINCMGYTKEEHGCKLFMSGPLQLGGGEATSHCYVKAKPGVPFGSKNQTSLRAPDVKLLAGLGRVHRSRSGGYNNVGEGMCELEDGSEPMLGMHECEKCSNADTDAMCQEECDAHPDCAGYSATDGGCLTYSGSPLVANGMDAQDGFQCFQKVPDGGAGGADGAEGAEGSEGAEEDHGPCGQPPHSFGSDEERAIATQYAEHWQGKTWTSQHCHVGETYPCSTQMAINELCTDNPDPSSPEQHQCECMISKAHSCYVLCLPETGQTEHGLDAWDVCMADCYPTPTCKDMCQGGTPACKQSCVEEYGHVSAEFKVVFEDISHNVQDFEAPVPAK